MRLLITGGAGFIGSALIRHIIKHTGDTVLNVDSLTYAGCVANLSDVGESERYSFSRTDIRDRASLEGVFDSFRPNAVIHLAAESHVDRSICGPAPFIETNIIGTYTLLEVARAYWQGLSRSERNLFRFHNVSTDEVYGDLPHPSDYPLNAAMEEAILPSLFTEETAYQPSSPYSASKAAADHLVRAWGRTYGLPVLITNCSNNYGPYQYPEKLIPLTILNALSGCSVPVYGKGDQIRDWLFVEDHVRALYKVLTEGRLGETYNIGGHNEKTNLEVVEAICCIIDELQPPVLGVRSKASSLIRHVEDRPGHDRRYAIDAGKIERELGWVPKETFERGIRKTVQWYLENLEWCRQRTKRSAQCGYKGLGVSK